MGIFSGFDYSGEKPTCVLRAISFQDECFVTEFFIDCFWIQVTAGYNLRCIVSGTGNLVQMLSGTIYSVKRLFLELFFILMVTVCFLLRVILYRILDFIRLRLGIIIVFLNTNQSYVSSARWFIRGTEYLRDTSC